MDQRAANARALPELALWQAIAFHSAAGLMKRSCWSAIDLAFCLLFRRQGNATGVIIDLFAVSLAFAFRIMR